MFRVHPRRAPGGVPAYVLRAAYLYVGRVGRHSNRGNNCVYWSKLRGARPVVFQGRHVERNDAKLGYVANVPTVRLPLAASASASGRVSCAVSPNTRDFAPLLRHPLSTPHPPPRAALPDSLSSGRSGSARARRWQRIGSQTRCTTLRIRVIRRRNSLQRRGRSTTWGGLRRRPRRRGLSLTGTA